MANADDRRILRLPEHWAPVGPATARIQRRWTNGYLVLWAICVAAGSLRKPGSAARTRAAGLIAPGGGYLYQRRRGRFALSLLGGFVGFASWFVFGMMWAPFAAWAAAATLAARAASRKPTIRSGADRRFWAVAAAGPLVLAGSGIARKAAFLRDKRRAGAQNAKLAGHRYVEPVPRGTDRPIAELTPEQLAAQRYILDRALQPVDEFEGYLFLDQFRESAVRYQLNYSGWGLALSQYRCTPAFDGYNTEAQRRLIEKMTAKRIWSYWRWENLWGNFDPNPDPIRKDNIMLSGYYGAQLAAYTDVTGDHRYDRPGSLEFRWNSRKTFRYDAPAIAEVVARNFEKAELCQFPCEPNWVYTTCNSIAMVGLLGYDRLHGTTLTGKLLPRFREAMEMEFSKADGRGITTRASRMGISVPGLASSTCNEAAVAFWLSPTVPDVAMRKWLLLREYIVGPGRRPVFQTPADRIDLGNYQLGWGQVTYVFALAAAKEMGDDDAVEALETSLAEVAPPTITGGALEYPATVSTNLMLMPGIFGGERAWHDLIAFGTPKEQHAWPKLTDAAYPDVLVARAVSRPDSVDLVLYPGNGSRRTTLGFANLAPGRDHLVKQSQATFTTDAQGRGSVATDLDGRTELSIVPA